MAAHNGQTSFFDTPIYSFEKRYEKIKEQYPDKSVLVWVSDQNIRYEDEVNSYLSEHKKNYVLCFKNLTYDVDMVDDSSNFISSYAQLLSDAFDNGEKFDIIDTGLKYQGFDTFYNPYQNCVNNNFLEPLNTYLENTECGKKIYAEMSTNYWKSLMINGKIYGIGNYGDKAAFQNIVIRKDVLDEFLLKTKMKLVWLVDAEKEIKRKDGMCDKWSDWEAVYIYEGDSVTGKIRRFQNNNL